MSVTAPIEPRSAWQRFLANLTAFAEAAEMGGLSYLELRVSHLEGRVAALEGTRLDGNTPAEGN